MQISGATVIPATLHTTYELLTDADAIVKAMPGMKSMTQKSDSYYDADIEVGVAGIKGRYQGSVEMKDVVQPTRYTLVVKGEGAMGFMEAEVAISLNAKSDVETEVTYDAEAKVGGVVAGVGQRVLSGVAKLMIKQFMNGIANQAKA
ncbi:CoxG family protein [Brevibacillus nitrificans]|uniref:CoxG family protein n=1 Tax=Brevibacillus nitrificans TaxID=651560 RepID=UPI00260D955E|nr:SRPBCC domain-containing protein [Brevibacillus nitrificans]MED1791422.1 SRPBCC domain-containing protein [Brevibacillus nitrificans]